MNHSFNVLWPDWEVVELIGSGNFGVVYKIRRCVSDEEETAAVKMISIPREDGNIKEMLNEGYDEESITAIYKDHLQSIISEYSLMKKLSECPNIVNCDDVKSIQHDNGIGWDVYIKMELLTPLANALPQVISEDIVIKLAKDICNALVVCNQNDVLHRDIKPQNIFMSANGDYKLGDFGISKIAQKTSYGTHVGTPKYMAPEVYNNQPYGISADIYSLGLVLYWMLNERRMPFLPISRKITMTMDEEARMRRLSGEKIPAPANGSDELKRIVLKACAFDPQDRYKTPLEMLQALNNIGKKEEPKAVPKEEQKTEDDEDYNLYYTLSVTKQELVSGCTKKVYGEKGKAYNMIITPNTDPDALMRLNDAGKLNTITGKRGFLYVKFRIVTSASDTSETDHKKKKSVRPFTYDKKRYKNEDWSDVPDEHLLQYMNQSETGCITMILIAVAFFLLGGCVTILIFPEGTVAMVVACVAAACYLFSPDHKSLNKKAAIAEWNKRHPDDKK